MAPTLQPTAGTAAEHTNLCLTGPKARHWAVSTYTKRSLATLVGTRRRVLDVTSGHNTVNVFTQSPPPPASVGRPDERPALKQGGEQSPCSQSRWACSAHNSWISRHLAAKSLILEATPSTSRYQISTSQHQFPTSSNNCRPTSALTYLSLNSLKKKEKTRKKGKQKRRRATPRVDADFPRVSHAAYFLSHELNPVPRVNSWDLMGNMSFKINDINEISAPSTNPRVALPVVTLSDASAKGTRS